jgi:hypothetical protein
MMDFRFGIRLEVLDARDVPSVTPIVPAPVHSAAAISSSEAQPLRLVPRAFAGWMAGEFAVRPVAADQGERIDFTGQGRLAHTGLVTVTGHLDGVGLIVHGQANGTITVSNRFGSVTFELAGPRQSGFSPLPTRLHYQIVGGTGRYTHAKGEGMLFIDLQFQPAAAVNVPPHGTIHVWV